jgi:hypothetical protein
MLIFISLNRYETCNRQEKLSAMYNAPFTFTTDIVMGYGMDGQII